MSELKSNEEALESLRQLSKYVSNSPTELEDQVKDLMNKVLQDNETQFKVFIVAYTKAKINRVMNLLNYLESVEDKLFDVTTIENSNSRTLLAMHDRVSASIGSVITLSKMCIDLGLTPEGLPQSVNVTNNYYGNTNSLNAINVGVSKDSRDNIRAALTSLMTNMNP